MNTKELLIQFIDYKNITRSEFCKKTNLSNGFFTNKGAVGSDKLHNILKIYPEINPEWLLTGKGNMLREPPPPAQQPTPINDKAEDTLKDKIIVVQEENIAMYKEIRRLERENKKLTKKTDRLAKRNEALEKQEQAQEAKKLAKSSGSLA